MKKTLFITLVVLMLCVLCFLAAPTASAESESVGNGAAARLAPYPGQIVEIDGTLYFQMDGVNTYMGLFQYYDGNYYYAKKSGALAVNATVNCTKTSCDLPTGNYRFDENGRLANGIFESNGKPRYYENGKSCAKGFFKLGEDYYFAKEGGYLVADAIYKPATTACDLPAGVNYRFDENGAIWQGFHELADGTTRYYVNGKAFKAGLMLHTDGYYYYVKHSGILCKNMSLYATYSTCDLPINTNYRIGEDGRLVSGILQSGGKPRYYENGKGKNAGLVKVGEDYYYAAGSGWLRTSEKLYAQITSCDLPANTNYYFDAEGKAYQGINKNSNGELTYFVNGKGANVGLFLYTDGCYYFAAGSGKLIVNNEKYYAYKTSCDLPVGTYEIDENGALIGYGEWYTALGLEFVKVTGGYAVSKYIGNSSSIVIPTTYEGLPIISIANSAFKGCTGLTYVKISSNVITIEKSAFSGCTNLQTAILPPNLTSIDAYAFYKCAALKNIEIPSSVTSLGGSSFSGCKSLTSVVIPSSVTSFGTYVFASSGITSAVLPYGLTVIPKGLFALSELMEIEIPSTVTSIDNEAFSGCNYLSQIIIPVGVEKIGKYAFSGCIGLTLVYFSSPSNITTIGDYAFAGCKNLTSFKIPQSVTTIGKSAFQLCEKIQYIYFENTTNWRGYESSSDEYGAIFDSSDLANAAWAATRLTTLDYYYTLKRS